MHRPLFALFVFAVLAPGCVPVTEPVGDIDKAEPDKNLVGDWGQRKGGDTLMRIDLAPEVKGNPKGLMRMESFTPTKWHAYFFLTTVGKERYGNICGDADKFDFDKEGEYAKWAKSDKREYVVFHYAETKDGVSLNFGDEDAFEQLMRDEKITGGRSGGFNTPPGWLAKYLDKSGPGKIFPDGGGKLGKFVKTKK